MDLEKIKLRLKSLGYECTESDKFALDFVAKKVEQNIKHFCNIDYIPECMDTLFIDACCGEFLQSKKSLGQLTTMQVEGIVNKIKDGDTEVSFSSSTDADAVFNAYLDKMINGYTSTLVRHRKLVW